MRPLPFHGPGVDKEGRSYIHYLGDQGEHRVMGHDEVCDFCCVQPPTWEYPAAEMEIVGHPEMDASDDEWGACDDCHALIEAHKPDELIALVVKRQRRQIYEMRVAGHDVMLPPGMDASVRQNVLRFFDARTGRPRPYAPRER